MSFRGLDFSAGVQRYGDIMAQGYKDKVALDQQNREWENKLTQQDFSNNIQQTQADYLYPQETVIAPGMAQAVVNPNFVPESYQRGYQDRSAAPTKFVQPVPGGMKVYDGAQGPSSPTRNPSGADSPQPVQLDDATHEAARQLGLEMNDKGQLIAKGARGKQVLDLYEKLIGASASAYAAGAVGGKPVVVGAPPNPRTGGTRTPKDPRLDQLKASMAAEGLMLKANSTPYAMATNPAAAIENQKKIAGYQAQIDALSAAPAAKPTAQASSKTVVQKQINRKLNKTKLIYSDGTSAVVDGIQ